MKTKITKEMRERFKNVFDKDGFEVGMKIIRNAIDSAKSFKQLEDKLGDMIYGTEYYDNSTDLLCVFLPSEYSKDQSREWTSIDVIVTWNFGDPEDPDNEEEGYISNVKLNVLNTQTGQVFHLCSFSHKDYQIYTWLESPALDEFGNELFIDGYGEDESKSEMRSKNEIKDCRKRSQKRVKKSRSTRCNMKKYMIFSWEGLCCSPDSEGNENSQILGCAMATNEKAAINKFIRDNPVVARSGFDPSEFGVVRLHDEVELDDIFIPKDYGL